MKIVLTRETSDNQKLRKLLENEGIKPDDIIDYPCISFAPVNVPAEMLEKLLGENAYRAVIFTSRRAVRFFMNLPCGKKLNSHLLIAAVGNSTAREISLSGYPVRLVAPEATADSLAMELCKFISKGEKVLYIRGNLSTGSLREQLNGKGIIVDEIIVYKNEEPSLRPLNLKGECIVVCASPSAFNRFIKVNPEMVSSYFIAIGPVTAESISKKGARHIEVSHLPDDKHVFESILKVLRKKQLPWQFK